MSTTAEIQSTSIRTLRICAVILVLITMSLLAQAQQTTTIGTVTSVTRTTLIIRINETEYGLFTINNNTTRPAMLPVGSIVEVTSTPTPDPGIRRAQIIRFRSTAAGGTAAAAGSSAAPGGGTPNQPDNVPAEVHNAQRTLDREARFYHLGFQGGFGLDPETAVVGAHAKFGPIFNENLAFRPVFEYAFGEVSHVFTIGAHLVYNIPLASGRRDVYFGGGPSFNWVEQSFGKGVNWSDFNYDAALDILAGVQFHNGVFAEIRPSIWTTQAPVFKMIVGYSF